MQTQINDQPGADIRPCLIDPENCACGAGGDSTHGEEALAEVWCGKCDQPATVGIDLTTGETVFRCSEHAWLIVAPRGRKAGA